MPEQKPKAKSEPAQNLGDQAKRYGAKLMRKLFDVTQDWDKHHDIVKNNYELGRAHFSRGNLKDAILRFKLTTWLEPDHADAWYYLGCSYLSDGNEASARKALRKAVQLKPGSEEAVYMLAIALGAKTPVESLPKKMPRALAQSHFDALAADFTQDQLETYQYQGHIVLTKALRASLQPGRIDHTVLELGVGTGLCGPLMRDISAQMTGVDISGPMLAETIKLTDASGKKLYDSLIHRDLETFLRDAPAESYDVVLAAGVFSYIGDLSDIFSQGARVLKTGGRFGFTADKLEGEGYRFDPAAGRFRFSASYLRGLAASQGLKEISFGEAPVYPDYPMVVCVFGK